MRAKKALKRLRRVEELLSIVIDEFSGNEPSVRQALDSAKKSVIRAKAGISSQSVARNAKKPQSKAKRTKRLDLTAEERKRISLAIKGRSTVAKRTSERKMGTTVKLAGEKNTTKNAFPTPPILKPADRPLAPEAPPETNPERHAN
jgi:hypothetical protein